MFKKAVQGFLPNYRKMVTSLNVPSSYIGTRTGRLSDVKASAHAEPRDTPLIVVGSKHLNYSPYVFAIRSQPFSTTSVNCTEAVATKTKAQTQSSAGSTKSKSKFDASSLPKLPVPSLPDTLAKFMRSVKPLLNDDEFEETLKVVKEFENGVGPKLQQLLEQRALKENNWLSEWWLNTAYLEYQDPVVVYSSPGLVFPLEDFQALDDQIRYAAKVVYGALNFKKSIDQNTITPDSMGKLPLDMSQYNKVLGTNRNPGEKRDELVYHPNSKHYVLAYKNHFFKIPAYNSSGDIFKPDEIFNQLYYAINEINTVTSGLSGIPFGFLTSDNRSTWSKSYARLQKDKETRASMNTIAEALFLLAVDRPNRPLQRPKGSAPGSGIEDLAKSDKQTVAALQMIHGNRTNSGNRWYDKTIQFIVGNEGECGLTYEHSPAEGPPIANLMDFIVGNLSKYESLLPAKQAPLPTYNSQNLFQKPSNDLPEKLIFNINSKISAAITESKGRLDAMVDDLDMACFTFQKYGRNFIKSAKFSPDSYIQMAIQATFYRIHSKPAAHYESASTRMYAEGRTETIRSCSSQSLDFSKALISSISAQEKYTAMKLAIEGHKQYASEAVRGFGVDRHLLGLKLIALQNKMEVPKLYSSPGFVKSSQFRISTSQVPSAFEAFMCYGPLVQNGYGCCYNPQENTMSFGISAFNSSTETNAEKFKIALQETLLDMQKVALQNMQAKL